MPAIAWIALALFAVVVALLSGVFSKKAPPSAGTSGGNGGPKNDAQK